MKKRVLTLAALALISCATFAQQGSKWIGGEISSTSSESNNVKVSSFTFGPQFGYYLNDKWAIGVGLNYSKGTDEASDTETSSLSIVPFARYTFAQAGKFDFFINGGLSIGSYKDENNASNTEYKYGTTAIGINPGICYNINDKFAIQMHLPALLRYYSYSGDRDGSGHYLGINDGYSIQNYVLASGFSFVYKF